MLVGWVLLNKDWKAAPVLNLPILLSEVTPKTALVAVRYFGSRVDWPRTGAGLSCGDHVVKNVPSGPPFDQIL